MSDLTVIGVDPGSHSAGISVLEGKKLIYSTTVEGLSSSVWDDNYLAEKMQDFLMHLEDVADQHEPVDLIAVELTSVQNNMHTNKLLSYWEAVVLLMAATYSIPVRRFRTKQARKLALGSGSIKKAEAIMKIRHEYGMHLPDDEAEAIIFALAGVKSLEN